MKHRYHVAYQYHALTIPGRTGFGSTEFTYDNEPDITSRLIGLMRQGIERTLMRESGPGGYGVIIFNAIPLVIEKGDTAFGENPFPSLD